MNNSDYNYFSVPNFSEFAYGGSGLDNMFKMADNKRKESAMGVIQMLMASSPAFATIIEGLGKNEIVQLVISDKAKAMLASGKWEWAKAKDVDGFFRAIIKDVKTGEIKENPLVSKEMIMNGVNMGQMAIAMQGMAIQQQLMEISEKLDEILGKLNDVIAGQVNDRVGLFNSAEYMYREAQMIKDPDIKKQLTYNALSNLSVAIEQIKLNANYNISKIADNYDDKNVKFKKSIKDEDVFEIKKEFCLIHRATALKVAMYCNEGEYNAAVYSLLEYKDFLEKSLAGKRRNAMYYADRSQKTIEGFWKDRSMDFPKKIDKICNDIKNYDLYYIEYSKKGVA